jgi:hypothetical protein
VINVSLSERAKRGFEENKKAYRDAAVRRAARCVYYAAFAEEAGLHPDCLLYDKAHWIGQMDNCEARQNSLQGLFARSESYFLTETNVATGEEIGPTIALTKRAMFEMISEMAATARLAVALIERIEKLEGKSEEEAGYANPSTRVSVSVR